MPEAYFYMHENGKASTDPNVVYSMPPFDQPLINRTRGTNGYFPKIEINIDYDENDNPIGVEILW